MEQGKHLLQQIQVGTRGADEEGVKRADREAGASLVEFALVLPVFLMLLLGMMTGGLAYSRKLSLAEAARESARFGATLPITSSLRTDSWLTRVAELARRTGDGELEATRPGQFLCVAYVPATGSPRRREETAGSVTFTNGTCIPDDGRSGETRVQVVARRTSTLEALVFSRDLDLTSHAVARFEVP